MMLRAQGLAELPNVRHGFFTREGGVSEGPWAALNVGLRGGDRPEHIAANRARAAAALGLGAERLVTVRQMHGVRVERVTGPWDNASAPEADGLVTATPDLLLGVLSADCGPILLADPVAGVVGAAHAGWKGALAGIAEATVAAMVELGASRPRIAAALGPCIAQASYEVGPEFVARFAADDPESAVCFRHGHAPFKALFDLKAYVGLRLRRAGLDRIELLPEDTCAESARFFSFRRTTLEGGERFGLQLSAIARAG